MYMNVRKCLLIFSILIYSNELVHAQQAIQLKALPDSIFYFTDKRDHTNYKAISFQGTSWMAEPLRYKTSDSWCYEGKAKNCRIYGRMYSWEEATKVCPLGWRLPNNKDWDALINQLGGYSQAGLYFSDRDTVNFRINLGYPPNINGRFAEEGSEMHFWSASEYNVRTGWQYFIIRDKLPFINSNYISKNYDINCLCVKDEASSVSE